MSSFFIFNCSGSCCVQAFFSCRKQGLLFTAVHGLLTLGGFSWGAQALGCMGFRSCSTWAQDSSWALVVFVQLLSRVKLCDPRDRSTSGFPVLHNLLEFAPTHVHWVSDTLQPSHPLSPPSRPTLNLSQHQGIFQGVSSLHQVAKGLEP